MIFLICSRAVSGAGYLEGMMCCWNSGEGSREKVSLRVLGFGLFRGFFPFLWSAVGGTRLGTEGSAAWSLPWGAWTEAFMPGGFAPLSLIRPLLFMNESVSRSGEMVGVMMGG